MRDEILAMLLEEEPVRQLEYRKFEEAKSFFRSQFETLLSTCARRHPFGFYYIAREVSDKMMLRYHLWTSDWAMPPQEKGNEIHDHVYQLNSLVLAGAIRHETFALVLAKDGRRELCEVRYTAEGSALHRTGERIELQAATDDQYSAGTAYRLRAGVFHRVTPYALPTATLVLTVQDGARALARVAVERGKEAATDFPRTPLTVDEITRAKAALASLQTERDEEPL